VSSPGAAAGWAAWLDDGEAGAVLPVAEAATLLVAADARLGEDAADEDAAVGRVFVVAALEAPQAESSAAAAPTPAAPQARSSARRLCM